VRVFRAGVKALCPPGLQSGYDPCRHLIRRLVFSMTHGDEICVRLHSLNTKRLGLDRAERSRAMSDSAKLQIVGVLLLICGTLGLLVMMRY